MSSLVETLNQRQSQSKAEVEADWWRLVYAAAGDGDVTPDEAEAILTAAAKTTADLANAAALYTRRLGLAEEAEHEAEHERAARAAADRRAAVAAEFARVRAEFEGRLRAAEAEQSAAAEAIGRARAAREELRRTCPYKARLADLRDRQESRDFRVRQAAKARGQAERIEKEVEAAAAVGNTDCGAGERLQEAARLRALADSCHADHPPAADESIESVLLTP
jgi:hypothetical protein